MLNGKPANLTIFDDVWEQPHEVYQMIQRIRENDVATECYLIKRGAPIAITIPPKTNLVQFLRLMYAEHGSGKLYIPRQLNKWDKDYLSKWELLMWGGGRQKASKIKVVEVWQCNLPKTIQLIEMMHG